MGNFQNCHFWDICDRKERIVRGWIMSTLIMMVGVAGSGKSTYAKTQILPTLNNGCIISSDDIREELTGDASDQKHNQEVWAEVHRRIKSNLIEGKDVILDATNVSLKDRNRTMLAAQGIPNVDTKCVVVLATVEDCMEHQKNRERQVPKYAIIRQMSRFQLPTAREGWTNITFYNTSTEKDLANRLVQQLDGFTQTGKWHTEDALQHTQMVSEYVQEHWNDPILMESALMHDVGKYYTREVDEEGNMHFFGHAGVSAYLYLTAYVHDTYADKKTLQVEQIIEKHMTIKQTELNTNKFKQTVGNEIYERLINFTEADHHGAVTREQLKQMSLLDFLNTFSDWHKRLQQDPFNIKITEKDGLYLFKYNQFASDMSYRIPQECRGSIFRMDENGKFQYACRPFDKFFNHGEPYVADINWATARVTEKVDGSLMKCFYDNGQWKLATNNTIDAFDAPVMDYKTTFGNIFERNIGMTVAELGQWLDKNYTYMFELTSPETQVVIPYPDGVYYLSRRETQTGKENFDRPPLPESIKYPYVAPLKTLNDVIETAKKMSKDEEGFVVNDLQGNRQKFKSPEYLIAAHLIGNGAISKKRIVEYIKDAMIDDFLAYSPQHKPLVDEVKQDIENIARKNEAEWEKVKDFSEQPRAKFAAIAGKNPCYPYLFFKLDNPECSAKEFLLSIPTNKLLKWLGYKDKEQTQQKTQTQEEKEQR